MRVFLSPAREGVGVGAAAIGESAFVPFFGVGACSDAPSPAIVLNSSAASSGVVVAESAATASLAVDFVEAISAGSGVEAAEAVDLEGFVAGSGVGVGGAEASSAGGDVFFEVLFAS